MRRASSKLLSLRNAAKPSSQVLRRLTKPVSSTAVSDDHQTLIPPCPKLKPYGKSNALLFSTPRPHQFYKLPSQNFCTQAEDVDQMSSEQREIKEKHELVEAFKSAVSTEEMLKAFSTMEGVFEEEELGMPCLKLGLKLLEEGEDPEIALAFATRALNSLYSDNEPSLPVAMNLQLIGSANYSLKRFNDSLAYYNKAQKMLSKLEQEGSCEIEDIRPVLYAVHHGLASAKNALGRREDALENHKKCLEIKELNFGKDSKEVGKENRDLADAYVEILNFKEALPHCLKALEIHEALLGQNSAEVAHDRRLLGVIYTGLRQHEKALEQNQQSQTVLKQLGLSSDLIRAEIDAANMQIDLGRYDSAVTTLRSVVSQCAKDSVERATSFVVMAKALIAQQKHADAKRCLEIAVEVFEEKESSHPAQVAEAYMDIAAQYEPVKEFETSISLLKRALALLEKVPLEQAAEGTISARIGWLLMLTGKVSQAIPYMESAAETLKEAFGPKHFSIGCICNNLGAAYMELERPQSAAQMFTLSKDILDACLGPCHNDSIEACHNLSKAYGAMGSYALAIEFQQKAIDAWNDHGPSAESRLREARHHLEQLKLKASGLSDATEPFPSPSTEPVTKKSGAA